MCGEGPRTYLSDWSAAGSPPRVWGRPVRLGVETENLRFTPTCVGKAARHPGRPLDEAVHPHVCGEGSFTASATLLAYGSPPRVWGRRLAGRAALRHVRFTPTCVGKAPSVPADPRPGAVHPHVCGEGANTVMALPPPSGSPPRVWGRRAAANSPSSWRTVHPHVCGEGAPRRCRARPRGRFTPTCVGKATNRSIHSVSLSGSPPRVWGRPCCMRPCPLTIRFTPTCVGKARPLRRRARRPAVHPHVCGEGSRFAGPGRSRAAVHPHVCGEGAVRLDEDRFGNGSPPRVWGRPTRRRSASTTRPVHPHVCGEGSVGSLPKSSTIGSPPRVWGRRPRSTGTRR